jgi:hypothetical protein
MCWSVPGPLQADTGDIHVRGGRALLDPLGHILLQPVLLQPTSSWLCLEGEPRCSFEVCAQPPVPPDDVGHQPVLPDGRNTTIWPIRHCTAVWPCRYDTDHVPYHNAEHTPFGIVL